LKAFLSRAVIGFAILAVTACSNPVNISSRPPVVPTSAPTATPAPVPTPTPTTAPASIATTASVGNGAAITNAPVATAVPAPAGYAQNISIPLVNVPAGTSVALVAGPSTPPQLVPLGARRAQSVRRHAAADTFDTIFYDSIQPSAPITVAGNLSFTQSFPGGGLTAGTQYYLAFYDTTQANPSWQTISGPVTPSGNNLTFTGTVSSFTLQAGKLYGFATFSTVTPTATPPPAPQTLVYFGDDSGLTIMNEAGTVQSTLAIPSNSFDLDDSGNVYAFFNNNGSPTLQMYPAGSATATVSYTPSILDNAFVAASGAGEVVAVHMVQQDGTLAADIWDPGKSGTPSRTITTNVPTGITSFGFTHDGTLYMPNTPPSAAPEYEVFPPGASTPSTTIPETIVAPSQYDNFAPNYVALGADGTLYVTEYTFGQPDPNAGLYVYPVNGTERFIPTASDANGAGPQGVDVDGSNNIYVVNNNSGVTSNTTCQGDSLQSVTVYNQAGQLQRTIGGGVINSGFPITVAADGTAFVASFPVQFLQQCTATGALGIFRIAPGASTATQISQSGSTEIVLYDGTHKTAPFAHTTRSVGGVGAGRAAKIRLLKGRR
jgi:hypothetical protein